MEARRLRRLPLRLAGEGGTQSVTGEGRGAGPILFDQTPANPRDVTLLKNGVHYTHQHAQTLILNSGFYR